MPALKIGGLGPQHPKLTNGDEFHSPYGKSLVFWFFYKKKIEILFLNQILFKA